MTEQQKAETTYAKNLRTAVAGEVVLCSRSSLLPPCSEAAITKTTKTRIYIEGLPAGVYFNRTGQICGDYYNRHKAQFRRIEAKADRWKLTAKTGDQQ